MTRAIPFVSETKFTGHQARAVTVSARIVFYKHCADTRQSALREPIS